MTTKSPAGSATGIDLAALEQLARAADPHGAAHLVTHYRNNADLLAEEEYRRAASPATMLELIALARATPQHPQCPHDYREQSRDVAGNRYFSCIHCHAAKTAAATPQHSVTEQAGAVAILRAAEIMWNWAGLDDVEQKRKCYERILSLPSTAATQPEQHPAGVNGIPTWQERIAERHPNSEAQYWPEDLKAKYLAAENADLRAALAIPASTAPDKGEKA